MGLLTQGEPMTFAEIQAMTEHVRKHGILQFINQYHKTKYLTKDKFLWGDELETMIVKFDHSTKRVVLSLKHGELVDAMTRYDERHPKERVGDWMKEFAAYQVESIPAAPYGGSLRELTLVESNMRKRREQMQAFVEPDEVPLNLSVFPRMGCGTFTHPHYQPKFSKTVWKSMFIPHEVVNNSHFRFQFVAQNLPLRRGQKMNLNIPIFKDRNTPSPFVEDLSVYGDDGTCQKHHLPDHIYMDTGVFGNGNSCLQLTLQGKDIHEARILFDQMVPMCPILMALSAASPAYRGHLSDIDHRWPTMVQATDDRTAEERGLKPLKRNKRRMSRTRYNHAHLYLSHQGDAYNDVHVDYDEKIFAQLLENGIDAMLARHVSHLFCRDAISMYRDKIHIDDTTSMEHFENINSSYWQSLRFKVPPPNSDIGWRVEVRPMDMQVTDFENAAYCAFVILLTRAILKYDLNLIIPISKVDENMTRYHKRNAVLTQKFNFRKEITPEHTSFSDPGKYENSFAMDEEVCEMSINEIINGKAPDFPGLMYFVRQYISSVDASAHTRHKIHNYMDFISKRASGEIETTAERIRQMFVTHPDYQCDSVVTERMTYDVMMKLAQEEGSQIADWGATKIRN